MRAGGEETSMAQTEVEMQSPLVKTLPPATDYLTYLTVLEYNLDKAELPLLHRLLRDPRLTTNIGWDLVHLLLPLLPESEDCLMDVARLGNPRETVLKVAELLEECGQSAYQDSDVDDRSDNEECAGAVSDQETPLGLRTSSRQVHARQDNLQKLEGSFKILLQMLCLLHPRIETKCPSRFFLTSLNAVLSAFHALADSHTAFIALLNFSKKMSSPPNTPRPLSQTGNGTSGAGDLQSAPDPEKEVGACTFKEWSDITILLRSFLTRAMSDYVNHLQPIDESSPFAWTGRFLEQQTLLKMSLVRPALRDGRAQLDRDALSKYLLVRLEKSVG